MPPSVTSNRPAAYGLRSLTVGDLATNCYLFWDPATHEAAVIDPGDEPERVLEVLRREHLRLALILNTHGHADHIGGNDGLKRATGAPLWVHPADRRRLTDPAANLSLDLGRPRVSPEADGPWVPGSPLAVGSLRLRVLHTPGHTPGSVCLLAPGVLFSGDTLFTLSVGRTDLPGGDPAGLEASLRLLLETVPDATLVLPGHGPSTRFGDERLHNPYLTRLEEA
jgi:hydroxyacylglutathione hydrolase